ncbi:MAG: 2-hydroxyacid dehydrogenase [Nitrospiria bacterium]
MTRPIIFLTRVLPKQVMAELDAVFDLRCDLSNHPLSKTGLIEGLRTADGMISMLSDSIDYHVIQSAPHLKIISNYAVGYNNIDIKAASERSIPVTNTPGVLTETTADLCWALLMAIARRIPEADTLVRSRKWKGWAPTELLGTDVYGKKLGIIGMGRIGQAVARRATGFSMQIQYFNRNRFSLQREKDLGAHYLPLSKLLETSDFLSLHLPLNDASRHMIDAEVLKRMKPSAFLINTARGPIVDEQALICALQNKQIAGAGLDVFEEEPAISPQLLQMRNVVTLPHIGSASTATRIKMGSMVYENLRAFFDKRPPPNMVN